MDVYISQVLANFDLPEQPVQAERYGHGHINETYRVMIGSGKGYILQKVNTSVFKNIDVLMSNLEAITSYLSKQTDDERRVMRLVKTTDGKPYLRHTDGTAWRMFIFVENSICLQKPECPEDVYQCAVAFGKFQHLLRDFPADTLQETIPNFHNTRDRYRIFREILEKDPLGRAKEVQPEIAFALSREEGAAACGRQDDRAGAGRPLPDGLLRRRPLFCKPQTGSESGSLPRPVQAGGGYGEKVGANECDRKEDRGMTSV